MAALGFAFDALGTSFSLQPLRPLLVPFGLGGHALELWFSRALRDAFALEVSGTFRPFSDVLGATLAEMIVEVGQEPSTQDITQVLEALSELPPRGDLLPALELLRARGARAVLLTNGAQRTAMAAVRRAGLDLLVTRCISADEVRHYKPAGAVYLHAARELELAPRELALISAHPWDVHGARRAGLRAGFVMGEERLYPPLMAQPDVAGSSLVEVVRALLE